MRHGALSACHHGGTDHSTVTCQTVLLWTVWLDAKMQNATLGIPIAIHDTTTTKIPYITRTSQFASSAASVSGSTVDSAARPPVARNSGKRSIRSPLSERAERYGMTYSVCVCAHR